MFGIGSNAENIVKAINNTQAVIQFSLGGYIESAYDNFLNLMGYQRHEVIGQNHKIFIELTEANSDAY